MAKLNTGLRLKENYVKGGGILQQRRPATLMVVQLGTRGSIERWRVK